MIINLSAMLLLKVHLYLILFITLLYHYTMNNDYILVVHHRDQLEIKGKTLIEHTETMP